MENEIIPIFYAFDCENEQAIIDSIANLPKAFEYEIHILYKGEVGNLKEQLNHYNIKFDEVSELISDNSSDYYKFAIPKLVFCDKAIYIDVSTSISFDVEALCNVDLKDYYIGAYHDNAFDSETMASYTENVLGISHYVYVNDDILVLNPKALKKGLFYERFLEYHGFASFSVRPTEALLNLACKDNALIIGAVNSEVDEVVAIEETKRDDSFLNKWNTEKRAKDRVELVKKIANFEKDGIFDQDVEEDVPGRMIMPDEIKYIKKSPIAKLKAAFALKMAKKFFYKLEKKKMVMIDDEVDGLENFAKLDTGAIITCNHFNAMDSFAMHWVYLKSKQKKRKLYRIIREGNYTSYPGFYGFLMRNFYTLPLSSNHKTMKKFMVATNELLQTGHFVLVYPEQSMWWNYRKPKPLKPGAFSFASKNQVPVLPIFISMRDSEVLGPDGYYVQKYKMHIEKPIYPNPELNARENTEYMLKENERIWKEIYEREYQIPLEYTTETFEL
ncbi:MAG: 1-acyl-sn-glycerol-3-phosphate acyltransferase [Clostridia bacterium]|nr:1-acyl-sn-glycerol-3-phosphate acyltransferase [Clostridia bacterium]